MEVQAPTGRRRHLLTKRDLESLGTVLAPGSEFEPFRGPGDRSAVIAHSAGLGALAITREAAALCAVDPASTRGRRRDAALEMLAADAFQRVQALPSERSFPVRLLLAEMDLRLGNERRASDSAHA